MCLLVRKKTNAFEINQILKKILESIFASGPQNRHLENIPGNNIKFFFFK